MDNQKENTPSPLDIEIDKPQHPFFDRIAFLLLSDTRKAAVAEKVLDDLYTGRLFWAELILSSIIATLGLLTNSTAVVIGAMLIAPILRPIQAIAFSVSTGSKHMYMQGLRLLFFSLVLSIGTAVCITFLVPFQQPTSEILARTAPTILDLLIALASGTIAILSLGFTRLSESLAGVAMAASLIPPLCVTGIGLAWFSWQVAWGSLLLFLANLIAIVAVGVVIFYAFGFFPTNKKGQKTSVKQLAVVVVSVLVVLLPLVTGLQGVVRDIAITQGIQRSFSSTLMTIDSRAKLASFDYMVTNRIVEVAATIKMPETVRLLPETRKQLVQTLANTLDRPVALTLEIIPTSSIFIPKETTTSLQDRIQKSLNDFFSRDDRIVLLETTVREGTEPVVAIELYAMDFVAYDVLQKDLSDLLQKDFATRPLIVLDIKKQPEKDGVVMNSSQDTLHEALVAWFPLFVHDSELLHLEVVEQSTGTGTLQQRNNTLLITFALESSSTPVILQTQLTQWKRSIENNLSYDVLFEVKVTYIDLLRIE